MKKLAVWAITPAVLALLLYSYSYGAEAQAPVAPADKPKEEMAAPQEYVSDVMPPEVSDQLNLAFMLGVGGRKDAKVFDKDGITYGVAFMVSMLSGDFDMFVILEQSKDEKGQVVPDSYEIKEVVAVKFLEPALAWYKSADVKRLYEEATK